MKKILSTILTLILSLSLMAQVATASNVNNDTERVSKEMVSQEQKSETEAIEEVNEDENVSKNGDVTIEAVVTPSSSITAKYESLKADTYNTFYGTVAYDNPSIFPWTANFVKYIPRFAFNYCDPISGNVSLDREYAYGENEFRGNEPAWMYTSGSFVVSAGSNVTKYLHTNAKAKEIGIHYASVGMSGVIESPAHIKVTVIE